MPKSPIPLPREHGAWAMVVGPALVGLAAPPVAGDRLPTLVGGLFLVVALLALFCLQYVLVRQLTAKRKDPPLRMWAGVYSAIGVISGGVLAVLEGHTELIWLGAIASVYFGLHLVQVRKPGRREHRALWFELLTVAVLCLGAPAGAVVAGAGFGEPAAWAYLLSFAFFAGSVFHVRAIVRRLQKKSTPPEGISRANLGRESIAWHGGLTLVVLAAWTAAFGGHSGANSSVSESGGSGPDVGSGTIVLRAALLTIAFAPAIFRAARAVAGLRAPVWNLRTIGFVELGCTVAFVVASAILLGWGIVG